MVSQLLSRRLLLALPIAALVLSDAALAQELEEVIVEATRVQQNQQTIPVAVTSFTPNDIEQRNAFRIDDLGGSVPNLIIRENTGLSNGATIFVRGVGEDDSRIGADPAVGIYIDDQYYGRQLGGMLDLVAIERVEILRGPQGTLYGRNSNGGAVKVYTRRPSEETEFDANVTVGDYAQFEAKLRAAGQLSDGLFGQFAYAHKERDGWYDGPMVPDTLGEVEKDFFLGSIRRVTDNGWDMEFKVDFSADDSDPNFSVPAGTFFDLAGPEILAASFGNPALTDDNLLNDTKIFGLSMRVDGELGGYDFKSVTGYRNTDNELVTAIGFFYTQDVEYSTFSQEFQLSESDGEGIDWVAGAYFYLEDSDQDTFFLFAPSSLDIETTSLAAFGQLSFGLTDSITGTLGGRVTSEEKQAWGQALSFGGDIVRLNGVEEDDTTFDVRAAVDVRLSDDVMAYGSITTGSKAFGWSSDDFGFVDTEQVITYEAGVRSELAGRTVRLNATAFYNDYEDLQLNGTTATAAFTRFNADEVHTNGVEVELNWLPSENLRIDASVGWQDGEYDKLSEDVIGAFQAATVEEALSRDMKNLPDLTYRVGATFDTTLGDGSQLTVSGDYSYSGDYFTLLANTPTSEHEATGLLGARFSWRSPSGKYHAALWGKNLTDEEYVSSASGTSIFPGAPLTFGIDFGVDL